MAKTLSLIEAEGGQALAVEIDVSRASDVAILMQKTLDGFGRLDCAVNNAAVQGQIADTGECSEENWDHIVGVNLKGLWLCMKHEIEVMLAQGGGRIINIGSNFSLVGGPGMPAYCASKHGVIGLTKAAALEYAGRHIFVNAVCPGPTSTHFGDKIAREQPEILERMMEGAMGKMPMGRLGHSEEVAEAILWCCSDSASYMVGSILSVDGGFVAQ